MVRRIYWNLNTWGESQNRHETRTPSKRAADPTGNSRTRCPFARAWTPGHFTSEIIKNYKQKLEEIYKIPALTPIFWKAEIKFVK